jgi:hypothetical protein
MRLEKEVSARKEGGSGAHVQMSQAAYLAQQAQHAEAPAIDFQLRSARETTYTARERVKYVQKCVRHGWWS